MKLITIIGARPQFIKASALTRLIMGSSKVNEIMIHTGQHYDDNMSLIFFEQLGIPKPKYNLGVGSLSHGHQTAEMIKSIEDILLHENPDAVLVYGDTNSTLAGALSAVKLNIPVAHVEAGLRSFNGKMPEEINRKVTDHVSDILFAPTNEAMVNLNREGLIHKAILAGDIMLDALNYYNRKNFLICPEKGLPETYYLATIHRAENTNEELVLKEIFMAFSMLELPVVFPLHPRTKQYLQRYDISPKNVRFIEPVGYFEMLYLISNSSLVLTDSGGLQKEAYFLKKQCVTLRKETEWVETLEGGWNQILKNVTCEEILKAVSKKYDPNNYTNSFGDGKAAEKILKVLLNNF